MTQHAADPGCDSRMIATGALGPHGDSWEQLLHDWAEYEEQRATVAGRLLDEARLYGRLGAEATDENRRDLWYAWAGVALQEALDPLPCTRKALEARRNALLRGREEPGVPPGTAAQGSRESHQRRHDYARRGNRPA
jgi:hypothetical protein